MIIRDAGPGHGAGDSDSKRTGAATRAVTPSRPGPGLTRRPGAGGPGLVLMIVDVTLADRDSDRPGAAPAYLAAPLRPLPGPAKPRVVTVPVPAARKARSRSPHGVGPSYRR